MVFAGGAILGAERTQVLAGGIRQLHDGGDGGVEVVALDVGRHLLHHAMALTNELLRRGHGRLVSRLLREQRLVAGLTAQVVHLAPQTVQELVHARQAVLVPQLLLLGRPQEQDVGAHGVGAVFGDHLLRRDHVALRLAHHIAVGVEHHALAQQVREGLVEVEQAAVAQHLGKEAAVEQVQDGVLNAADVLIDRHPSVSLFRIEGRVHVVRVGVAHVVPAGAREGVHGVGLALGRAAANRAGGVHEPGMGGQRLAGGQVDVLGQAHGQIFLGHGHHAALLAVDSGDGVAPVALAADKPVAQAKLHGALAATHLFQRGHDGCFALGVLTAGHARVGTGLHENALGGVGLRPVHRGHHAALLVLELRVQRVVLGQNDGDDGQIVLAGELEISLVAAGHGHDGAGAVVGHDVVAHPHGHLLAIDGVHHVATGERAVLLMVALSALDGGHLLGCLNQLHDRRLVFGAFHEAAEQLAFRRQQEEAAAEQRVGAGGEHGDNIVFRGLGRRVAVTVAQDEVHVGALGAADPVGLLLLHALGPAFQLIQVVQQLLGVVGNLVVPLGEVALLHLGVASPAATLDDLLVGEHGAAARTPVHRRVATLHETALPELQKDPLAPAVVLRIARHHFAIPVVGKAHAGEALLLGLDVLVGPDGRMAVMLDGGVLRGQAEGVPTHGMQHVEALHLGVAGHHVAIGVVARMPHVHVAGGIREHLQDILLGRIGILRHRVQPGLFPSQLQTGLDLMGIVSFHGTPSKTWLSTARIPRGRELISPL